MTVSRVTGDLFGVWGFQAQLGRGLRPEDDGPGRPRVGVLSDRHWRQLFDASPAVIGETVFIGDVPHEIVGVLPPDVEFSTFANIAVWTAVPVEHSASQDRTLVAVTGRLAGGVTVEQAAAEMGAIAGTLAAEHPDTHRGRGVLTVGASRAMGGPNAVLVMTLLIGTSVLVLVIASVNVSGVLLARAVSRQREFGLRMALGAGAVRVLRQQLTEGALLALISAVGGLVVAVIGLRLIHSTEAEPVLRQITLDGHELAFVALLALVIPCLVTAAPALAARRVDLVSVVNAGTARAGHRHTRVRQVLVVAQLTLAVMLTIVGSLAARSAVEVVRLPIGFDPSKLVTFVLALEGHSSNVMDRRVAMREIERQIESYGGLAAGALERYPVALSEVATPIAVDRPVAGPESPDQSAVIGAADSRGLFALGVPVIAGRTFVDSEVDSGAPVALISREAARRYLGDQHSALSRGLTLGLGADRRVPGRWRHGRCPLPATCPADMGAAVNAGPGVIRGALGRRPRANYQRDSCRRSTCGA